MAVWDDARCPIRISISSFARCVVPDQKTMLLIFSFQVSDFVDSDDPVRVLTDTHVLEFGPECQVYKEHRATNTEIKHLCSGRSCDSFNAEHLSCDVRECFRW